MFSESLFAHPPFAVREKLSGIGGSFLVDCELTGARCSQVKENEAVADRFSAAIEQRKWAIGKVGKEIGEGHFARGNESGIATEESQRNQHTCDDFDKSCRSDRKGQQIVSMRAGMSRHGKVKHLVCAMLQEEKPHDDTQYTMNLRRKPV